MNHKIILALVAISLLFTPIASVYAGGKGLKVNLSVYSDQPIQQGTTYTFQHGDQIYSHRLLVETTEYELEYPSGLVDVGNFRICITLDNGISGCGNGYNSQEKRPESVHLTIRSNSDFVSGGSGSSCASSSSSQSESSSEQSQSQSRSTTIINCPANARCVIEEE